MSKSYNSNPDFSFLSGERVVFALKNDEEWSLIHRKYSEIDQENWTYFTPTNNYEYPNLGAVQSWKEQEANVIIYPTFTEHNELLNKYLDELEEITL